MYNQSVYVPRRWQKVKIQGVLSPLEIKFVWQISSYITCLKCKIELSYLKIIKTIEHNGVNWMPMKAYLLY